MLLTPNLCFMLTLVVGRRACTEVKTQSARTSWLFAGDNPMIDVTWPRNERGAACRPKRALCDCLLGRRWVCAPSDRRIQWVSRSIHHGGRGRNRASTTLIDLTYVSLDHRQSKRLQRQMHYKYCEAFRRCRKRSTALAGLRTRVKIAKYLHGTEEESILMAAKPAKKIG